MLQCTGYIIKEVGTKAKASASFHASSLPSTQTPCHPRNGFSVPNTPSLRGNLGQRREVYTLSGLAAQNPYPLRSFSPSQIGSRHVATDLQGRSHFLYFFVRRQDSTTVMPQSSAVAILPGEEKVEQCQCVKMNKLIVIMRYDRTKKTLKMVRTCQKRIQCKCHDTAQG